MPVPSPIPNVRNRKRILAGTQTVAQRGTAVARTFPLYGDLRIDKRTPLADRQDYHGTYDVDFEPSYGPTEIDGSFAQPLTYEDLAILPRYAVKGQVAGVSDGNPTPGYTYTYSPSPSTDDLDAMTLEHGFEGIVFLTDTAFFDSFNIRGDADDAAGDWMWDSRLFARSKELQIAVEETAPTGATGTTLTKTGAGWTVNTFAGQYVEIMSCTPATAGVVGQVRKIVSNTADTLTVTPAWDVNPTTACTFEISGEFTAAVSDRDTDPIKAAGTLLYVSDSTGAVGESLISGRFKQFNLSVVNNLAGKRMMEDVDSYSAKLDRGVRRVTAQVTMEFDDWREQARWEEGVARLVRITQPNGPIINASGPTTRKNAKIDLPLLYWEQMTEDVRGNNILATYGGRGFVNTTLGYSYLIAATNRLAALP